jgi:tetratricopeptide (TPR) repeat protein
MARNKLFLLTFLSGLTIACTQTTLKQSPGVIVKPVQTPAPVSPSPVSKVPYETVEQAQKSRPLVKPKQHSATPKPAPTAPALNALAMEAEKHSKAGDFDSASVALERALRINPRDAHLTYQLAQLRLKQGQSRLAEELAKKAAFLAASDPALKKQCWLLIAEIRRLLQDFPGAEQAQTKANSLE